MLNEALFSSNTEEWYTPQDFFDKLNSKYNFTLDPCATSENAKCKTFFTKEQNGLNQKWGGGVFCNPPYGKQLPLFVKKAYEERKNCDVIILLIPARTDTRYFHDYLYKKENVEIEFIKGRLKFGGSKNSAPFPSMICKILPPKKSPSNPLKNYSPNAL